MVSGKEVRFKKLFKHSERVFILPMDHGITIGPAQGLGDIRQIVHQVNRNVDAVVVHKGMVGQLADCLDSNGCELIVHLSASTALSPDPNRKELVTSVEEALRKGATGISVHVNLGSAFENQMLQDLGKTAERCDAWGIPLLAMMYVRDGSAKSEYDVAKIKHAARVAEELGADMVKVNYTGSPDTFSDIVSAVKIPVIIAGGPKTASDYDLLEMIHDAVCSGARGVAIGRNLFQHAHPSALSCAIRKILDEKVNDNEIQEMAKAL